MLQSIKPTIIPVKAPSQTELLNSPFNIPLTSNTFSPTNASQSTTPGSISAGVLPQIKLQANLDIFLELTKAPASVLLQIQFQAF